MKKIRPGGRGPDNWNPRGESGCTERESSVTQRVDLPAPAERNSKNGTPAQREEKALAMMKEYAAGGVNLKELAAKHGVHRNTAYLWLLGGLGDKEHAELVTGALTARVAEADESLEGAKNYLDLGKARERMRFSRMDLERRRPGLYGQKQMVAVVGEVRVSGLVGRATELLELDDGPPDAEAA